MQIETPMPVFAGVETRSRILISGELIAYARFWCWRWCCGWRNLDSVPLMPSETHNALAAWRAVICRTRPARSLIPTSAILFDAQSISFGLMGGSEFAARIATALAGVALILLPALFRPWLGKTGALLVSLLLAFSPVLLIASRTSSAGRVGAAVRGSEPVGLWQAARTGAAATRFSRWRRSRRWRFLSGSGGVGAGADPRRRSGDDRSGVAQRRSDLLDGRSAARVCLRRCAASLGLALASAALVVVALATGFHALSGRAEQRRGGLGRRGARRDRAAGHRRLCAADRAVLRAVPVGAGGWRAYSRGATGSRRWIASWWRG